MHSSSLVPAAAGLPGRPWRRCPVHGSLCPALACLPLPEWGAGCAFQTAVAPARMAL